MHNIYTKILASVQKYFRDAGIDKAVIGVSGGIDSALCLKLTADALGPENVTGLLMPEKGISNEENLHHAKELCNFMKVEKFVLPINKYLTDFLALPWTPNDLAQINIKARIRMCVLYSFANTRNAMVIGTSNKTELAIGYGTKFGDLAGDIEVIGDLFKGEVYELAEHVGLPDEFIHKVPSAELYTDQTYEAELGMTYKEIDQILKKMEEGFSKDELINKGLNPHSVHKVFRLHEVNQHKLKPAFLVKSK